MMQQERLNRRRRSTNHDSRIRKRPSIVGIVITTIVVCYCWLVISTEASSSSIRKQQPEVDTSPTTPVIPHDPVVPQSPPVSRSASTSASTSALVEHVAVTSNTPTTTIVDKEDKDDVVEDQQSKGETQQQSHPATSPVVPPSVTPKRPPTTPVRLQQDDIQQEFLDWCATAGIQTNLTIQMFEYTNYMTAHYKRFAIMEGGEEGRGDEDSISYDTNDDDDYVPPPVDGNTSNNNNNNNNNNSANQQILRERGLAAMHDIAEGEVVISIPFTSMIAVPLTIDEDPILNKVMGPTARKLYEWDDDEFYEFGLLTVALLYHRNLGRASPLYNYISILETATTEHFPFLWPKAKLRQEATDGVRRHARAISKDMNELYDTVLGALRRDYPVLFDTEIYSLDNFMWAFALVHSRLWHLPIPDLHQKRHQKEEPENHAPQIGIGDQVPPASLPTEEWMQDQGDTDEDDLPVESHSFLAPVADLLNFGPPCTKGTYNTQARAFELVATCSFLEGQEVTYWYSDDCDDIVIANYGFTHPMVPACPTMDDLQQEIDMWRQRSQNLETEIGHAYDDLDMMERELERAQSVLTSCNCDGLRIPKSMSSNKSRKTSPPSNDPQHDHIRGSTNQQSDHERGRGIRHKTWNHQKSDGGL